METTWESRMAARAAARRRTLEIEAEPVRQAEMVAALAAELAAWPIDTETARFMYDEGPWPCACMGHPLQFQHPGFPCYCALTWMKVDERLGVGIYSH